MGLYMPAPDDMTEPKRWPNYAEWARIDSIGNAIRARNCLKLASQHIADTEALRNLMEAIDALHQIEVDLLNARGESERSNEQ